MKSKGTGRIAGTLIEKLLQSLDQAARHEPGEIAPPAAVLWTDADEQWKPLLPLLLGRMPQLFVLGVFAPERRTGPAIWLKCVIAGTLESPRVPEGTVPILYLPGLGRQDLRGEDCKTVNQPLVELQYRGTVWTQKSGKDWTVEAFLVSDEGLGLDLAKDAKTRQAMARALEKLAVTPLTTLAGRRLEAEDFDRLLVSDKSRDLLAWMSDPKGTRALWGDAQWSAFKSRCREEYKFDPEMDGETMAGERLGMHGAEPWLSLWERFREAPGLYPGIPDLLTRAKPSSLLFDKEPWPDENDQAEKQLRQELLALKGAAPAEAMRRIAELDKIHGARRRWVWAKIGRSPLAKALEHLASMAGRCVSIPGGDTPDEMARLYSEGAYLVDDALLRALAETRNSEDSKAVGEAIRAVYLPWADAAANRFQEVVERHPLPPAGQQPVVEAGAGECILFADGLRFDLAQRLAADLEGRGLRVARNRRWAALPTVTPNAKPAVSPMEGRLAGKAAPEDFSPALAETGQPLNTDRFRKLLADCGYDYIGSAEAGKPGRPEARGWAESGQIDKSGHNLQGRMEGQIEEELERLAERIVELLNAGWKAIRLVTDHGWLLLPGGLPRHDLPHYLVAGKWARCAAIKGESRVAVPKARWHWNPAVDIATAPGVSTFIGGQEYAHGGLSLQECLLPDLRITAAADDLKVAPRIVEVRWTGLRCRVTIQPIAAGLLVDLRTKAGDKASSVAMSPKPVEPDGKASLVVANDDLSGSAAFVVLMDASGSVIAKETTSVGGGD